jgi:hypothetical protein
MMFDLKPTVEYAEGDQYYDDANDDVIYSAETPTAVTSTTGGMCTEVWEYTAPRTACVKFEGTLTRKFNTGDTSADLVLGYTKYTMHAMAGLNLSELGQNSYKFAKMDVDFTTFTTAETGAVALATSAWLLGTSTVLGLF